MASGSKRSCGARFSNLEYLVPPPLVRWGSDAKFKLRTSSQLAGTLFMNKILARVLRTLQQLAWIAAGYLSKCSPPNLVTIT